MLERAVYTKNLDVLQLLLNDKRFDVNEKISLRSGNDDVWDEEKIKEIKLIHKEEEQEEEEQEEEENDKRSGISTIYSSNDQISILHYALYLYNIDVEEVQLLLGNENIDVNAYSFLKEYEHTLTLSGGENEKKKLEEKHHCILLLKEKIMKSLNCLLIIKTLILIRNQ